MNANFQVRRVTGYDPGYPVGRRRPGRLEARPLKFLFLVVGFLFFFVGFGCDNIKGDATDTQNKPDTTVTPDNTVPDLDDLQGVTDPDFPLDDAAIPDADEILAGDPVPDALIDVDEFNDLSGGVTPDDVIETPDYDDQLAGELVPDFDETQPDLCPVDYDDVLTGDAIPDAVLPDTAEQPDYDDQLSGVAPEDMRLK